MAVHRLRLLGAVTTIAGVVLLALVAAWPFAPRAAEYLLHRALESRGIDKAALTVSAVGWSGATIEAVRLGKAHELAADAIHLDYHPTGLLRGRLDGVAIRGLRLRGRIDEGRLSFGAVGRLADAEGTGGAPTDLRLPADAVSLRDAEILIDMPQGPLRLSLDGTLRADGNGIGLVLDRCAVLDADPVRIKDYRLSGGPLQLCPRADDQPILALGAATGGAAPLRLSVALRPVELTVARVTDGGERAFAAALQAVAIEAGLGGAGGSTATATVDAEIRDPAAAPLFAPLHLAGEARLAADEVRFDGTVSGPRGATLFEITGRHALATGNGEAQIVGRQLRFSRDGLQPQALLPVLRGKVASVAGILDLAATLHWRDGALTSRLTLDLSDGAAQTEFAALAGIDGTVTFDSLFPPSTAPNQTLHVGLLNPGLPLRDGRLSFTLRPDGRVHLSHARWPLAGGAISLEQADIVLGAKRHSVVLRVRHVALAKLFKLLRFDAVAATGTVSGTVPVRIEAGTAVIEHGRLATEGGGTIRYLGEGGQALAQGGENAQLLLKALRNFHYRSLAIEVSGDVAGALDVALHISGANPDLYDGHPFQLNVSLTGELAAILRRGLVGYRIPDSIRRQLEGAD